MSILIRVPNERSDEKAPCKHIGLPGARLGGYLPGSGTLNFYPFGLPPLITGEKGVFVMVNVKEKLTRRALLILLATMTVIAMMPGMKMAYAAKNNNWTDHQRISVATGEPVTVKWDSENSATGKIVKVDNSSNYYPGSFVFWVGDGNAPTVTGGSATYLYQTVTDLGGGVTVTNKAYQITLTGAGNISVTLDNSNTYTLSHGAPAGSAPTAAKPSKFNGYLPVGQFARGTDWGSIHTDGSNQSGHTKKFIGGYSGIGVSLGAAGGYVDYDFRVSNKSTNPYGVDFIVYGNAFNGNPEAGAVKVFGYKTADETEGGKWYDLAGSLYYDTAVTRNNRNLTYGKGSKRLKYKYNGYNNNNFVEFGGSSTLWWPLNPGKDYDTINGIHAGMPFEEELVRVNAAHDEITYKDVCLVKDTDTNGDYQFGYFDVHGNGSNYGTAINPYTANNSSQGGDGYDLSWAVDENGEPVVLDHITKVRAYTAAALKTDGSGAFTTASIFGETSAEVCGIYGVNGTGGKAATKLPTVKKGDTVVPTQNMGVETVSVDANTTFTFTTQADNLYVNGEKLTSGSSRNFNVTSGSTRYVQVITQSGTEAPYVTVLKLTNR